MCRAQTSVVLRLSTAYAAPSSKATSTASAIARSALLDVTRGEVIGEECIAARMPAGHAVCSLQPAVSKRRKRERPSPEGEQPQPDKGYEQSHGYGPSHGGPSGPGDAPARPAPEPPTPPTEEPDDEDE